MKRRVILRALATVVAGAALAIATPLAASAHVHIDPQQATAGDYSYVTFRVPTESATARTVGLTITLPADTPFTSVSYQATPGWTAKVTTSTLPKPVDVGGATVTTAPTSVTFTATGSGIEPGQFGVFTLSLGKVPDTGKVLLPTTQTYSDGTVVKWDERTPANGDEPEHPAPTLYINDAPPADADSGSIVSTARPIAANSSDTGLVTTSLVIGFAGLVLGAAGIVVAAVALTRKRSVA